MSSRCDCTKYCRVFVVGTKPATWFNERVGRKSLLAPAFARCLFCLLSSFRFYRRPGSCEYFNLKVDFQDNKPKTSNAESAATKRFKALSALVTVTFLMLAFQPVKRALVLPHEIAKNIFLVLLISMNSFKRAMLGFRVTNCQLDQQFQKLFTLSSTLAPIMLYRSFGYCCFSQTRFPLRCPPCNMLQETLND